MSRSVRIAECSTRLLMHKTLRIIQLNVHKRETVQLSLMNDKEIRDYGVVAISEPYAYIIENKVVTSPIVYHN